MRCASQTLEIWLLLLQEDGNETEREKNLYFVDIHIGVELISRESTALF